MKTLALPALALALALAAAAPPAAAQDDLGKLWAKLQPARGVYTLRQRGAGESNGAVTMSGRMIVEARFTCEEFISSFTMDLRASSSGQAMTVRLEQKANETRDGKIYRFSSITIENGRETERREGQAVLQSREGPGEAKIQGAAGEDMKLDQGTVLPGTHMLRMIQAAAAGKKELEHRVFYGLDQMKVTNTRVTILGAGRSGKEKGLGEFADKPGWTIKEEHKEIGGAPGGASQTSETFLTEDGVATAVTISVQGLELQGTPLSLEKLPKPDCKN
jgi:hypothetical protein